MPSLLSLPSLLPMQSLLSTTAISLLFGRLSSRAKSPLGKPAPTPQSSAPIQATNEPLNSGTPEKLGLGLTAAT
jgi:hypothetical protein